MITSSLNFNLKISQFFFLCHCFLLLVSPTIFFPIILFLVLQCQGCERHGAILLIPGHGAPLSQHHCTEVDLMLFNCNGLLSVEYSFNGGWLAITVHFYQHNFFHFYPF
ncbi:hypothetical protein VitviT2T_014108 [Vitis vinifera]|uniref:Uncharacterized protein n=1 Tax=Vitis vinifera TaxID=29760 RepID=A0ABY9CL62_VITVI|nr:hypothetical protein VitviT2T_014108 [Vitis vinifera]